MPDNILLSQQENPLWLVLDRKIPDFKVKINLIIIYIFFNFLSINFPFL